MPSLIEIGPLVLEKKIFKIFQRIFTLLWLSPLGEGQSPSILQLIIPFPKDDLCQFWLKLAQWFWRRSWKCKSLQTEGWTDGRRTTGDQNSSLEIRISSDQTLLYQYQKNMTVKVHDVRKCMYLKKIFFSNQCFYIKNFPLAH
jgi:hypothetical protein